MHRAQCWCTVLLLLVSELSCAAAVLRQLLARSMPDKCMNTGSGWRYLADSQGFICLRDSMNYATGCCKQGTRFSCEGCKLTDKCCSEYEQCVSCCLLPEHQAETLFSQVPKSLKNPEAGTWPSAWEYCKGICRTHSASTSHENAYISARHHCFSRSGRPMLSDPLPGDALSGVTITVGGAGQSCDDACGKRNEVCSASHLQVLNSCDRLREQVGCEAGCGYGHLPGGAAPAYIDIAAPKASRPAMCFVQHPPTGGGNATELACSGRDTHARRLCPCKLRQ